GRKTICSSAAPPDETVRPQRRISNALQQISRELLMAKQKPAKGGKTANQKEAHGAGHVAWEWIKSGIIGFVIFLVVRTFLIQTFTIVSGSMEGTLLVGDFLVLNKSAYGATLPGTDPRPPGSPPP